MDFVYSSEQTDTKNSFYLWVSRSHSNDTQNREKTT